MTAGSVHLVLDEEVTRARVVETARRAGWAPISPGHERGRQSDAAWASRWPDVEFRYHDQADRGVQTIEVVGPDSAEAVAHVRRMLPVVSLEALVLDAVLATSREQKIKAVNRVAAAAGSEPHDGALLVFQAGLVDPDPAVREAAVVAAGTTGWPAVVDLLSMLGDNDPSVGVRETAARLAAELRGRGS